LDEVAVRAQLSILRQHSETMSGHAVTLKSGLAGLSF